MNAQQTLNRLQKAIDSIEEKNGYCLVASETENEKHVVTYNKETYYAEYCTCKSHMDCYHMVAVDRHFEDKHPNFYVNVRKFDIKAARRAAYLEMYDPHMVA